MKDAPPKPVRFGDLGVRLASGLAMAAVAMLDVWLGGFWEALLLAIVLALMIWELARMVTGSGDLGAPIFLVPALSGTAAVFVTLIAGIGVGVAILLVGAALVAVLCGRGGGWLAGGLIYMGTALCALVPLRHLEPHGILFVLWLILVVVATDVGAYFVGRMVGGPRLWPSVSPGKTRSGALGGLFFAMIVGLPIGLAAGLGVGTTIFLSLGTSIASQLGDLLESAVKRRFGVKDSSLLIPGHGGVMDRLDGIIGGVWFVAVCGMVGLGSLG